MYIRSVKWALVLFLVICVGNSLPGWAQSTSTGVVAGSVTDPTGAVVAGATVTLTDAGTNIARATTSNASGRYIYVDVNPGIYSITASKAGFATTRSEDQEVKVGASLTLNLALQVGGANVVVEVTTVGNELQTMNATVGNTITSIAIDNLPALGRDVSSFVELQPGVSPDGSVAGDATGGVAQQNNLGAGVGGPSGVLPTPQDSVEEFKVNSAGQTADFNSSAGAEVKVVTKRGTNAWHGTGYEYYKDNNWSSNSWQNDFNNVPLPGFHYSRFGAAIGGPLIPKEILGGKTYFFANYEGFRFPNSQTIQRNVPSAALRAGSITDPTTGQVFSLLSADPRGIGINPLVQQIWNTYDPLSNATCAQTFCDGANIQGFSANVALPTTSNFAVGRVDHDFSAKQHFMPSYRWFKLITSNPVQLDIGGYYPGDTKGVPASIS